MEFLVVSFFFQLCFLGGQKLQEEVPAFDRESIRRENSSDVSKVLLTTFS